MRKSILASLFVATVLVGCSDPKIDTSSDSALKSSVSQVRNSLPEDQRPAFDESLKVLAFSQINMKDVLAAGATEGALLQPKIMGALEGKTAKEVISEADRIKSERQAKEREQALAEIGELETKKLEAEKAGSELKNIEVLRSRFYVSKSQFMDEPIIELTVRNDTQVPISRIYFDAVLASPGRSVPWVKDDFNYSISGGLEPGEEQTWRLAPNSFSVWGKKDYPSDSVLTVTVIRADGADGEPIAQTIGFGEKEAARLADLKSKFQGEGASLHEPGAE